MKTVPDPGQAYGTTARRVTIADVSRDLGLTKGTVSRALNGHPDIAPATRKRVQDAATRMGYNPLPQAQAIRTGRTRSLGLVLQFSDHDRQSPFLAGFLSGISHAASQENWTLTVATSESGDGTLEIMNRLLSERKADGFILPRSLVNDRRVALLLERDVPFVLYGRPIDPEGCAWFDILGEVAMCEAVTRLAELGHERIGFVNGGTRFTYSNLRRSGFEKGMAEAGLEVDPGLILSDAVRRADGAVAARRFIEHPKPPTAIIFATDKAALGMYDVVGDYGLRIGREISLIGYDGIVEGTYVTPQLTTFAVDNRFAGERLASLLIQRVRGEAPENLRETASVPLMDRGSISAPVVSSSDLARLVADRMKSNGSKNLTGGK